MIKKKIFFDEIKNNMALICPQGEEAPDLLRIADSIAAEGISTVSVAPESANMMWIWLEKSMTKIYARFLLKDCKAKQWEQEILKLAEHVNYIFKRGADGAQVFVPCSKISDFVADILPIRDDLFFSKDLFIAINTKCLKSVDWFEMFEELNKIKANLLLFSDDKKNDDFVGIIYGMLSMNEIELLGDIHFMCGNKLDKIEQIWRLIHKLKPEISNRVKFFVDN